MAFSLSAEILLRSYTTPPEINSWHCGVDKLSSPVDLVPCRSQKSNLPWPMRVSKCLHQLIDFLIFDQKQPLFKPQNDQFGQNLAPAAHWGLNTLHYIYLDSSVEQRKVQETEEELLIDAIWPEVFFLWQMELKCANLPTISFTASGRFGKTENTFLW